MAGASCPERTEPVDLCRPDGTLAPEARGHTRRPLHRPNLRGWGRNKRWEYWGLVTPAHVVGVTVSDLDYAAVHEVYVLERASARERKHAWLVPLGRGVVLPDVRPPVHARARAAGLEIDLDDEPDGTHLRVRARDVSLDAVIAPAGDSLGVVVPWSERVFQYTVKSPGRPASGVLRVGAEEHAIPAGQSWAVLDRGRGRWPYHVVWNWAAGSGVAFGKRLGLQLGGQWTVGTGATENALFVDGVMSHLPEEVRFRYDVGAWARPWRIEGPRVEVELTPFHVRTARTSLLVLGAEVHQAFGTWRGWMQDDRGVRHSVDGLVGWAEQAENRW